MVTTRLDPIDRKILSELQADGRMTNVELAKRVGISAPPCLRRVRALEEAGLIGGYHADVNARELGFEVQVFAMVGLESQAEVELSAFEDQCRSWPLVRECHMLNGEVDFILKCVSPDLSTFQSFLTSELLTTPNVASVKTSLVIRGAKDEPGVPFDVLEERLQREVPQAAALSGLAPQRIFWHPGCPLIGQRAKSAQRFHMAEKVEIERFDRIAHQF
jgi:DNA-binding Lrp family transcriptional regulator